MAAYLQMKTIWFCTRKLYKRRHFSTMIIHKPSPEYYFVNVGVCICTLKLTSIPSFLSSTVWLFYAYRSRPLLDPWAPPVNHNTCKWSVPTEQPMGIKFIFSITSGGATPTHGNISKWLLFHVAPLYGSALVGSGS